MVDKDTEAILKKYGTQLNSLNSEPIYSNKDFSNEFVQFKEDMMPKFSKYERLCKNIGGSIGIKLAQKDEDNLRREINSAHLDVTPSQVVALATLMFIFVFIGGVILTTAIYLISNPPYFSVLLLLLSFLTAGFLFYYFYSMPSRLATQWRLKAGSQMVPCILYTVIYMKHTSNLERAIRFASEHLEPPLALDLKKVFWDVEVGRFSTIKESLDSYLESWRLSNPEFVESFNLIESSLYEPSDSRRIQILERALQVILDGVYDRMLKFTHDVKAPLTNLYMLGIVLPTLGLALLPLGSALLNGAIKWFHILIFFNILIPFFVFYMTSQIMATRPGGYGESSILELNPLYSKYKSKKSYLKAGLIVLPLFLIGIFPLLLSIPGFAGLLNINPDVSFGSLGIGFLSDIKLFDIIQGVGPMGPVALLMSLFIPLSVFLFFSISYKARTKDIIKSRDYSKVLEGEFNNSLFQLGNRIGDGTPAELAFGKVIESSRGQVTENFFKIVNSNIQSSGMSLEKAIFDPRRGEGSDMAVSPR